MQNRDVKESQIDFRQEQFKASVEASLSEIRSLIPAGKSIIVQYTETPTGSGRYGRLKVGLEDADTAVIKIYLPEEIEEIERAEKQILFIVRHEACHSFSGFFDEFRGQLSDDEIRASLKNKDGNNIVVETGQTEVIVDLTALFLGNSDQNSRQRLLESYVDTVDVYLLIPDTFLRDDIRFIEILKFIEKTWPQEADTRRIIEKLDGRINSKFSEMSKGEKSIIEKYQNFIKNIIAHFKDSFLDSTQIADFIKSQSSYL